MGTAWPAAARGAVGMRGGVRSATATLAVVWALSAAYVLPFVDRGWVPHDEGAFAQSAVRVLDGELPHRDFDELYTGALTWVHAGAMRLFGVRLASIRIPLLVAFLAFVPAYHLLAARFVAPPIAALVTLTMVAWTVPNDFSSRPSWYNLFLTVFGVLALLRHVDTGARRWLFVAGVCGGVACTMKVTGVYFLGAGLLFLAYREQVLSGAADASGPRSWTMIGVKGAGAALAGLGLLAAVWPVLGATGVVEIALPAAAIPALVAWSEARDGRGALPARLRLLARLTVPFAAGAAVPIAALLVPFALGDGVDDLVRGVFVTPRLRLAHASYPLPPLPALVAAAPYALLLARGRPPVAPRRLLPLAALLGLLLAAAFVGPAFAAVWLSAQPLPLVATAAGCALVVHAVRSGRLSAVERQELVLLVAALAVGNLVQLPYASPMYFAYVAPLALVTLAAVIRRRRAGDGLPHVCVLAFYCAFAVFAVNPGYIFNAGLRYVRYDDTGALDPERGGLAVRADHARQYADLVALVRRHRRGRAIFAGPDAPEVYFLSDSRGPTRALFDFLGDADPSGEALVARLERAGVAVAVVKHEPPFSPPLSADVLDALARAYPESRRLEQFTVRWKP